MNITMIRKSYPASPERFNVLVLGQGGLLNQAYSWRSGRWGIAYRVVDFKVVFQMTPAALEVHVPTPGALNADTTLAVELTSR